MARRPKALGVWLHGRHVADFEQRRFPEIRCRYTEEALESWPLNSPVLSCSLPLDPRPQNAYAFCRGLLPEGQALQVLASNAGVATNATFELLARYGRDVAGALIISEREPEARELEVAPYTAESLATEIEELDEHPLGSHDDSELSLAGLQDKLLLVDLGAGKWGRPLHGRPSTHILKVDARRHPGLVEAEASCMRLARAIGLTTVDVELTEIAGTPCIIVSRFDRSETGSGIERIHQEDACQALAIGPDGRGKYESAGGPSFRDVARLLEQYANDPLDQLDRLVAVTAFTVLIGNADAHGKNLAFLHPSGEDICLAPLYDTVPTALWPKLREQAAMAVGGQPILDEVTLADIVNEASVWSHPRDRAREVAERTVADVLEALESGVIPDDSDVADLIRRRAAELASSPRRPRT